MKKISFKKFLINYFNIILVNFLFADSNIIILLVGTFFSLVFPFVANLHIFLDKYYYDFNNTYDDIIFAYVYNFLIILIISILLLKLLVLPIFYNMLETKSKNVSIVKFIKNLKTKFRLKFLILLVSIIPYLIFNMLIKPNDILFSFLVLCVISGLFGSYLFLFFWWEIEKWWKNDCDKWYGSKRIKNTQLYLKISKIFNKIQDFNYQNFKKCQKIVFVIVTLICKWGSKVGLKINKVLKTKII